MFEAYSVSVRLTLINGVSAGLVALSREFGKTSMAARELQGRLDGIKRWALAGALVGGAGFAILAGFKPALDEAKKFQNEVAKFTLYGMGDKTNAEAVKFAKSMNVIGSSYVENMRLINEAQGIFRESGAMTPAQQLLGAKIMAPILAKIAFVGKATGAGGMSDADSMALIRFVEDRGGANDPGKAAAVANMAFRLSRSSGGVVSYEQLRQVTAAAGPLARTMSDQVFVELEPVIAALKGGAVGSGLRMIFQRLLGTQRFLPKQGIDELLSLGIWDPSMVVRSSGGSIRSFRGNPLRDSATMMRSLPEFYAKDFLPALVRKYGPGIMRNDNADIANRSRIEALVFGPGTALKLVSQMDLLWATMQRSVAAQGKQLGIDSSVKVSARTMSGQEAALSAKWHNLLEATGEKLLPIAVRFLQALQPPLQWMSDFATRHPRMFGYLVDGIAALGVVLVAAGAFLELFALGKAVKLLAGIAGLSRLSGGLTGTGLAFKALTGLNFARMALGITALALALGYLKGQADEARAKIAAADPNFAKKTKTQQLWELERGSDRDWHTWGFSLPHFGLSRPNGWEPGDRSYAHPASYSGGSTMQGTVLIDGKKVGQIVAQHIAGSMNANRSAGAGFDASANFSPVGLVSA